MPLLTVPRVALLAGPVALAFFAGGFGDRPRLIALGVAGLVLALTALASPPRGLVPTGTGLRLALGGLAGLAGWVALSRGWSPLTDVAGDDAERVALYTVAFAVGLLAWRTRAAARLVEPALAAGITAVTTYGLSGRLLPGLIPQTASRSAGGRFEQPLTYWNASGLYAVLGLLLCARILGDRDRPGWMRCLAAVATVPLGSGVYLTFSRGALAALGGGLIVLLVVAPTWTQLRGTAIALETAALGLLGPILFPAVRTLAGSDATRQREGLLVLAAMIVAAAVGVALTRWALRDERADRLRTGRLGLPQWSGTVAAVLAVAMVAVPPLLARDDGGQGTTDPAFGATSARLVSAGSHRYDYWRVGLDTFADHPLRGIGSGGYGVAWLEARPQPERIRDAHSLPIETLAELGLVGFLLLLSTAGGIALCARRVQAADPVLAAGPVAALVAFSLHASIDWHWELPAVTLTALALAGMIAAQASPEGPSGYAC
ncbi:MAG: O-antigen ligase family protein [Solirubrobacterales bacterium]|nr:O-antigen ligase family protein [Solirubrobacterales bacterium]